MGKKESSDDLPTKKTDEKEKIEEQNQDKGLEQDKDNLLPHLIEVSSPEDLILEEETSQVLGSLALQEIKKICVTTEEDGSLLVNRKRTVDELIAQEGDVKKRSRAASEDIGDKQKQMTASEMSESTFGVLTQSGKQAESCLANPSGAILIKRSASPMGLPPEKRLKSDNMPSSGILHNKVASDIEEFLKKVGLPSTLLVVFRTVPLVAYEIYDIRTDSMLTIVEPQEPAGDVVAYGFDGWILRRNGNQCRYKNLLTNQLVELPPWPHQNIPQGAIGAFEGQPTIVGCRTVLGFRHPPFISILHHQGGGGGWNLFNIHAVAPPNAYIEALTLQGGTVHMFTSNRYHRFRIDELAHWSTDLSGMIDAEDAYLSSFVVDGGDDIYLVMFNTNMGRITIRISPGPVASLDGNLPGVTYASLSFGAGKSFPVLHDHEMDTTFVASGGYLEQLVECLGIRANADDDDPEVLFLKGCTGPVADECPCVFGWIRILNWWF